MGRDRLDVRADRRTTRWHPLPQAAHDPERQF
jgi:hypothetical protein